MIYGQDPGSFTNQAATAGLKAVRIGFEYTPDGLNASKGTFDSDGLDVLLRLLRPERRRRARSPSCSSRSSQATYGESPDFYAANYYENTFDMWELIRRVWKGGDINSGDALQAALKTNLTLASVYGGDETAVGTFTLDPTTHSVIKREMGVFEYKDGKVTPKAFFNIGGADYRTA